jgi:hypothetical protein
MELSNSPALLPPTNLPFYYDKRLNRNKGGALKIKMGLERVCKKIDKAYALC